MKPFQQNNFILCLGLYSLFGSFYLVKAFSCCLAQTVWALVDNQGPKKDLFLLWDLIQLCIRSILMGLFVYFRPLLTI